MLKRMLSQEDDRYAQNRYQEAFMLSIDHRLRDREAVIYQAMGRDGADIP
jgi:hypothetical protein